MTAFDDPRLLPHATPESMQRVRDNAPPELQQLRAWVCGNREPKPGEAKSGKVPINPRTGGNAQSNNPSTWGTLDEAIERALHDDRCFGVGVNLRGSKNTGLDLDHVIDKTTGEVNQRALTLLHSLPKTYTEISPSGDGLRAFFCGCKPAGFNGCVIEDAFGPGTKLEVYDGKDEGSGRYLTVTGNVWGEPTPIATVDDADLKPLVELQQNVQKQRANGKAATSHRTGQINNDDRERAAFGLLRLRLLDPDISYHRWFRVGVALRELGDDGLRLWIEWSRTSKYYDEREINQKWPGIHGSGIRCLFGMFKDADPAWRQHYRDERKRAAPAKDNAAEPETSNATDKPEIVLEPGQLADTTRKAEDALLICRRGDRVFQRGSELVRVARASERVVLRSGAEMPARSAMMLSIQPTWLRARFEQAATFLRMDARSGELAVKDCPGDIAANYLQSAGTWRVPTLTAIVTAPMLRGDGTLLQVAGYDVATGVIFDPGSITFPQIPESPTLADAQAALEVLLAPVNLFPWANPHDRSVWLAAALTPFVRPILPAAPMIAFDSPTRGSGKTKAANAAAMIATGLHPALLLHVSDNDEQRKRLFALLLHGAQVACIDNVDGPLRSSALCSVLSEPCITERVLGESREVQVTTSCTFLATGNNIHVGGDLTRRVLVCRIDPKVESPEKRAFPFDPVDYARQHRPELVAAALTILRAHAVAGWPADGLEPFGTYERWSALVRAAIVWTGEPDPVLGRQAVQEDDDEHLAFGALLQAWAAVHEDHVLTLRQAMASTDSDLQQAIDAVAGDDQRTRAKTLGERLTAERGRVFDGLRFVRSDSKGHRGVRRWHVEHVDRSTGEAEGA